MSNKIPREEKKIGIHTLLVMLFVRMANIEMFKYDIEKKRLVHIQMKCRTDVTYKDEFKWYKMK